MKELLRRALTGIVYISLLLFTVNWSPDAFDILFLLFGLACMYEFKKIVSFQGYGVFVAYMVLWGYYVYAKPNGVPIIFLAVLTFAVDLALLRYVFLERTQWWNETHKFLIALFYIGGGCIFLTLIPHRGAGFDISLITGIFILVWVNDTFAYLVGKGIGKRYFLPTISPQKTLEGYLGGLVFSMVAAVILSGSMPTLDRFQWVLMAGVVVLSGGLGDLVESKFKRVAGVKDSGDILPGHGGLLDRLDSLLFAAPFAYLTLNLFDYVS